MAHDQVFHQLFDSVVKWHSFQLGLCVGILGLVLLYKTRPEYATVFLLWAVTAGLAMPAAPTEDVMKKPWYFLSAVTIVVGGGVIVDSCHRLLRSFVTRRRSIRSSESIDSSSQSADGD